MSIHRRLGPLALIIGTIFLRDVYVFLLFIVLAVLGFGVAFASMFVTRPGAPADGNLAANLTWAIFGDWTLPLEMGTTEWRVWFGSILIGLFLLSSNVILVNLLIAMMSDTYARIRENSDVEWKVCRL